MQIEVIGAGIVGLSCAYAFAERGCDVTVRALKFGAETCSWYAGGMIAPDCEMDGAEPVIAKLGGESKQFWRQFFSNTTGTLVVASPRDQAELERFAGRTKNWQRLDRREIAELEPSLAGRFYRGLFFGEEWCLSPRLVLERLFSLLDKKGVIIKLGERLTAEEVLRAPKSGWRIDCRGGGARDIFKSLRMVRGEMLLIRTTEVSISRTVRMVHPRIPLYIVPHGQNVFMIGATMIESQNTDNISVRSTLELLSAAYALDPAFGEAEIIEMNVGLRPAFPDNLPAISRFGQTICVNGLYRHGFLIAPALAARVADYVITGKDFRDTIGERDS